MALVGIVPISVIAGAGSMFRLWYIIVTEHDLDLREVRAIPLLK
jgi:hypothetical protein